MSVPTSSVSATLPTSGSGVHAAGCGASRKVSTMMITTNSVARLAQRCGDFFGDFGGSLARGYPTSLALCILDAIYSTGSHPAAVNNVVDRYIARHGRDDGAKSLRDSIAAAGGARMWAETVACNLK